MTRVRIGEAADRDAVIAARLAAIRRHRSELDAAEAFLVHVRQCRHDLLSRCPACSAYGADRGSAAGRTDGQ